MNYFSSIDKLRTENIHILWPVAEGDHIRVGHRMACHRGGVLHASMCDPLGRHNVPSGGSFLFVDSGDNGTQVTGPQHVSSKVAHCLLGCSACVRL
jgi:hypothetical protein